MSTTVMVSPGPLARIEQIKSANERVSAQLARRIVGQRDVINQLLTAFFAGGHCLLVGVPGLAKTLMIRTFSDALGLKFNRIQFTPDLMPADVTGTDIIAADSESGERGFKFLSGPIFANIVLADEINRTPPKTQASLLEAMEEHQVTVAGQQYPLPEPFFVMATQNPIEQEGTYPLPTAALDRFIFNIRVDYPSEPEELEMLFATTSNLVDEAERVLEREEVLSILRAVREVDIDDETLEYAMRIVRESRPEQTGIEWVRKMVEVGGSPRAIQALILGGKAHAALDGRSDVEPRDIRAIVGPSLRHRLIPSFHAGAEGVTTDDVIDHLLRVVPRPANDVAQASGRKRSFNLLRLLLGAPKPRRQRHTLTAPGKRI